MDGQNLLWYSDVLQNHPTGKDLTYRLEYDEVTQSNSPCITGSPNCTTETWAYSTSPTVGTITAPDGGVTREEFTDTQAGNPDGGLVYKSKRPDGTVVERIWAYNTPSGGNALNPYVKTEFTSIVDAGGNLSKTAIKDYDYDKNGNVRAVREYDWVSNSSLPRDANGRPSGIPAGAQLKRVTTNTYYNPSPLATDNTTVNSNCYNYRTTRRLINLPASSEVSDGSQPLARSEYFYDDVNLKGNLTEQRGWDSAKGGYSNPLNPASNGNAVSVSYQYDSYGNRTLAVDARGYQTQYTYGAINGFTYLYPTQVKTAYGTPVQRTTNQEYDFYTGLGTLTTDVDNNISSRALYDDIGRPTLVKAAEGKPEETRTQTVYNDVGRSVTVRADLNTVGDGKRVSIQYFDPLGRVRLTRQLEDASTESETDDTKGIKVQTRYSISGTNSYQLASNPYRAAYSSQAGSESTMGWTRSKTDQGGRVIEVQTFSGSSLPAPWGSNTGSTGTVLTAYDAEFTTVTDQAGKVRRSMTDALGRLVRVDEPNDINNPTNLGPTSAPVQATNYSYDALGNLIGVVQGVQSRSFQYSSLSRLRVATNPESGVIQYEYDANGNLLTRTDARNVVTSYGYDQLNRVVSRSYSGLNRILCK